MVSSATKNSGVFWREKMNRLNKIKAMKKKSDRTFDFLQDSVNDLSLVQNEVQRVSSVLKDTDQILNRLDREFSQKTKLNKKDMSFLMTAVALQVVRQYAIPNNFTQSSRPNDQAAAGSHSYNRDLRGSGYYQSSVEEILNNLVPFDTQNSSKLFGENLGGGNGHRFATLGHDPLLGWIFGTANIATRTVTLANFHSYHVRYGQFGVSGKGDFFSENAQTRLVIEHGLIDPFRNPNKLPILAAALLMEGMHLKSDINSKKSLALPGLAVASPQFAQTLSDYGLNMANVLTVGRQASLSLAINALIGMIHRLTYDESKDGDIKLFEVKTRKILSYSNTIASLSNVVYVAILASNPTTAGVAVNKLDIGGLLVTIVRLFSDAKFISQVKEEFLKNGWADEVLGEKLEIPKRNIEVYYEGENE